MNQAVATGQVQKAEVAVEKAEALEQSVMVVSDAVSPPPPETLTQPEVEAVDPAGEGTADMEAVANVVMNPAGP